jgi:hypothetical protein
MRGRGRFVRIEINKKGNRQLGRLPGVYIAVTRMAAATTPKRAVAQTTGSIPNSCDQ